MLLSSLFSELYVTLSGGTQPPSERVVGCIHGTLGTWFQINLSALLYPCLKIHVDKAIGVAVIVVIVVAAAAAAIIILAEVS